MIFIDVMKIKSCAASAGNDLHQSDEGQPQKASEPKTLEVIANIISPNKKSNSGKLLLFECYFNVSFKLL